MTLFFINEILLYEKIFNSNTNRWNLDQAKKNQSITLTLKDDSQNIRILDVGCGGGLLSEPMCRLGAEVTGIDASNKNINVAKIHSKKKRTYIILKKMNHIWKIF